MEISNISGPDYVPTGFSAEQPRTEEENNSTVEERQPEPPPPADNKGTTIDTYA